MRVEYDEGDLIFLDVDDPEIGPFTRTYRVGPGGVIEERTDWVSIEAARLRSRESREQYRSFRRAEDEELSARRRMVAAALASLGPFVMRKGYPTPTGWVVFKVHRSDCGVLVKGYLNLDAWTGLNSPIPYRMCMTCLKRPRGTS